MLPEFKAPVVTAEDFGAECRHQFMVATGAAKLAPFHKDKRKYLAEAEAHLDAYNTWLEINAL